MMLRWYLAGGAMFGAIFMYLFNDAPSFNGVLIGVGIGIVAGIIGVILWILVISFFILMFEAIEKYRKKHIDNKAEDVKE